MPWIIGGAILGSAVLGYMGQNSANDYNEEIAEAMHEYNMQQHDFNWQESQNSHLFNVETRDLAEYNLEIQRNWKNQQAMREWIDADKARLFDYNNQVKAYNASLEAYGVQLEYNDIANQLATEGADRAYNDKLILLGYQHEELLLGLTEQEDKIDIQRRGVAQEAEGALRTTTLRKDELKRGLKARQAELNSKLEGSKLKGIEAEGRVRALGQTGRSGRKNVMSAIQANLRIDDAIAESLSFSEDKHDLDIATIAESLRAKGSALDLQDESYSTELYNTKRRTQFGQRQLQDTLKSANLQYEADIQQRSLQKYGQDLRAKEMIAASPVEAPQISKPLEAPMPRLQMPRTPDEPPEPVEMAAYTPSPLLAGLQTGLGALASAGKFWG